MNRALKGKVACHDKKTYEIAQLAGIHPTTLSKFIYGYQRPTEAQQKALAKALQCNVEDIFP